MCYLITRDTLTIAAAIAFSTLAAPAFAQPPGYGFDFVTVGATGNAPWSGTDPWGMAGGRGSVGYEYRISRLEVTTAQWMEFVNTFSTQPGMTLPGNPHFTRFGATWWGAIPAYNPVNASVTWSLDPSMPDPAMTPVTGITWRDAAYYCNWLHNGKPASFAAIQDGAYDASTFGDLPGGGFSDQRTHHPDARYWIPTLDEWLKAAHYDPHRYGPGEGGWWDYSHTSNEAPVPGIPGVGQTTAGLALGNLGEFDIPLDAYPHVQSPWGLLDTSGGASEWIEDVWGNTQRMIDGRSVGVGLPPEADLLWGVGSTWPGDATLIGLRVVSAVPAPGAFLLVSSAAWWSASRRRRRHDRESAVGPVPDPARLGDTGECSGWRS